MFVLHSGFLFNAFYYACTIDKRKFRAFLKISNDRRSGRYYVIPKKMCNHITTHHTQLFNSMTFLFSNFKLISIYKLYKTFPTNLANIGGTGGTERKNLISKKECRCITTYHIEFFRSMTVLFA